jgi:hypothetical protein
MKLNTRLYTTGMVWGCEDLYYSLRHTQHTRAPPTYAGCATIGTKLVLIYGLSPTSSNHMYSKKVGVCLDRTARPMAATLFGRCSYTLPRRTHGFTSLLLLLKTSD